ncbi:MAG: 4-hydroxythreonine-4-phosphate dehydrogenase PdxA [Cellvibrionales bacterium]|nr:4-hydroxythreonine-4-phosphate dehydrogenase PdxA [Cellvibrionales bacterium]
MTKRLVLTTGEPAGIGPDLALTLSEQALSCEIITLGCPRLFTERAQQLGLTPNITVLSQESLKDTKPSPNQKGDIKCLALPSDNPVTAGILDASNAYYVLDQLNLAIEGCMNHLFDAIVTLPVQKSVINDAGIAFTGHTEFLAEKTNTDQVVMMLASSDLRVALVTTHLPLKDVPGAITQDTLKKVCRIVDHDLKTKFNIDAPTILVAGLNPHAGESGHLGHEEIDTIIPAINALINEGINLKGPLPADTLFTEKHLKAADCALAMYHDQGLPVLKYQSFGKAANITLGLPIIRTSVDHGTALDLAGKGNADMGSLLAAIDQALLMTKTMAQATTSTATS